MTFYFGDMILVSKDESRMAMIHATIDEDLGTIKVDVDFDSLPWFKKYGGTSVVAVFELEDFKNNGVFYTDANGLEMQKRILNYRPTWDLVNTNYKDSF